MTTIPPPATPSRSQIIAKSSTGIMLAAGQSLRFGQLKQLILFKNRPLICWSLEAALQSNLDRIYLVLGHLAHRIEKAIKPQLANPKLEIVYNPDYRRGMGSSLAKAVKAAGPGWQAYMALLADQPMLPTSLINAMLESLAQCKYSIVMPAFKGRRGNPVLFSNKWYAELCKLRHDIGGRLIVAANPNEVKLLEVKKQECLQDIDCPEDLMRLQSLLHRPGLPT